MPAWPVLFGGLLIGAWIGFWLRPAVAFGKKLSFQTVIVRGANLHGVDTTLVRTAETSFDRMLIGAVLGLVIGLFLVISIRRLR